MDGYERLQEDLVEGHERDLATTASDAKNVGAGLGRLRTRLTEEAEEAVEAYDSQVQEIMRDFQRLSPDEADEDPDREDPHRR